MSKGSVADRWFDNLQSAYSYTTGYDGLLRTRTVTNGTNQTVVSASEYNDPNSPNAPSAVMNAFGFTSGGTTGTVRIVYDTHGNTQSLTSARGTVTDYTWDYTAFALGRLMRVQTGTQSPTTFTYFEPGGLMQTATSPQPGTSGSMATVTSAFTYDSLGNVLTATSPGNNAAASITTTFNYTTDGTYSQPAAIGKPLTITDNLGKITHLRYDGQGNTVSSVDALGSELDVTFNAANQPLQVVMPATNQTGTGRGYLRNTYLYPGGPATQVTSFDESGVQTRQIAYNYGLAGEALGRSGSTVPVTYEYDAASRLKKLSDGSQHSTVYSRNSAGYLSQVVYPNGDTIQFPSYDIAGHLLQRVDGRGVVSNFAYNNPSGRLTDIQYPASPALNVHLSYDSYGRVQSKSDGAGSFAYIYDDLGNVTQTDTTYGNLPVQTITYSFYPDGSLQNMGTPGGSFAYRYDALGRPVGLTNPSQETFAWDYLDNGLLASQRAGGALLTSYTRNALGLVTDLANRKQDANATLLSDFGSIAYDGVGNQKSLAASVSGVAAYSGQTAYQYDTHSQLLQEQSQRAGGYTNVFGYDNAGNSTTFRGAARTFNSANQNTANSYDQNGNPTTYNGVNLTFDAQNHVTQIGALLTAGYRSDGLRAWKQNASGRTYYLYAGGTVPVCELDGSANVTAVNTAAVTGLLSRHTQAGSVFYAFDPQGNAAQRLDGTGAVLGASMFDAYGARQSSDTSTDPPRPVTQYRSDVPRRRLPRRAPACSAATPDPAERALRASDCPVLRALHPTHSHTRPRNQARCPTTR